MDFKTIVIREILKRTGNKADELWERNKFEKDYPGLKEERLRREQEEVEREGKQLKIIFLAILFSIVPYMILREIFYMDDALTPILIVMVWIHIFSICLNEELERIPKIMLVLTPIVCSILITIGIIIYKYSVETWLFYEEEMVLIFILTYIVLGYSLEYIRKKYNENR
ncbi:hypothetical protein [Niameybacter massiliensis]|uniref:hypothetical protein n=1 Tax=Niameybacter massiliensis TaxID=1658108 RepID=UPI0006B5F0EB|nr:hypothetical protein [Niameybacter massiliensis]